VVPVANFEIFLEPGLLKTGAKKRSSEVEYESEPIKILHFFMDQLGYITNYNLFLCLSVRIISPTASGYRRRILNRTGS